MSIEQLKSAYFDLQYCHRKFPAEHLSLLFEWFAPFSIAIITSVHYLSINIIVLYQFTVTQIKNFEAWDLGKKVQDGGYVFGSSKIFQRRKEWICESRCQVSDHLHVLKGFVCPLSLTWPQFMLGRHFTPSPQSSFFILHSVYILPLVRSLQSAVLSLVLHWPH